MSPKLCERLEKTNRERDEIIVYWGYSVYVKVMQVDRIKRSTFNNIDKVKNKCFGGILMAFWFDSSWNSLTNADLTNYSSALLRTSGTLDCYCIKNDRIFVQFSASFVQL